MERVWSWHGGGNCQESNRDVTELISSQEEADMKLILHAVHAAARGATRICVHSPDTDVFILALRRYRELCYDVQFVTGTGQRHRGIELPSTAEALSNAKIAALPALYVLSGADIRHH